MFQQQ